MAFPEKRILFYESPDMCLDPSRLLEYDAVMLPNFLLPRMADQSVDLFINTISLSEMEVVDIKKVVDEVLGKQEG